MKIMDGKYQEIVQFYRDTQDQGKMQTAANEYQKKFAQKVGVENRNFWNQSVDSDEKIWLTTLVISYIINTSGHKKHRKKLNVNPYIKRRRKSCEFTSP